MRSNCAYNRDMNQNSNFLTISDVLQDDKKRLGLTRACYRQIEDLEQDIKAFITVIPQDLTQKPKQGILAGIPIAVKDLYETVGVRTTSGSLFFKDNIPRQDAEVVRKLKFAGADIIGKTSTHEIALGITNINPHFGTPRNPWDTTRITGGSSGGSAAAVAAGMCMAALGSDTGGSIRIPASLCGVVGLKPTYGRVSLRGVLPLSWNLDHAGPLTRCVKDAALLMGIISGYDEQDPVSVDIPVDDYLKELGSSINGWQIALVTGEFIDPSDPEVLEAVNTASRVFAELGASVEEVEIDWLHEAALVNGQLVQSDGAAFHQERLSKHPELFGEDVRQRLEEGRKRSSSKYALAIRKQNELKRKSALFFKHYDAILIPSTPITALRIDDIENSAHQAPTLTRFTAPFNLTGQPALSVPCGFSDEGLPIGLQIVCGHWQEAKLLQAGHLFEQSTDWNTKKPEILEN